MTSATPSSAAAPAIISERALIALVGVIQFINILDFMMVMPLGPDFAAALGIPASNIGIIGGAYTFAAAIAGLVAALFLDQYARKTALLVCLTGLSAATLLGALAWDMQTMVGARLLAGLFGGPLTSLATALIADFIPPQRRGAAMGKVMGAFSAASVLGVPFGLELARHFSWHAPFLFTGALGFVILALAAWKLPHYPAMGRDIPVEQRLDDIWHILSTPLARASYAFMALSMMAGFMIIPNISAHLQLNLHYPRESLGFLYLCGGAVSFFGMRAAGRFMDTHSATLASAAFTGLLIVAILTGFVFYPNPVPVVAVFITFMLAMTARSVCAQTLSSKIPDPAHRGAYMSIQSAITHMGSALGAYLSSLLLVEAQGTLHHMAWVGLVAIGLSLLVPPLFYYVESRLKKAF